MPLEPQVQRASKSKQPVTITATTCLSGICLTRSIRLTLQVMTACPCTIKYSRLKAEEGLKLLLGQSFEPSILDAIPPTFTHSQRGTLSVEVSSEGNLVSIVELYNRIRNVAHLVESVLKRPDEHFLVEKSHAKPQFCEDLCREVSVSVASILEEEDLISITAELDESIHPHRAFARLSMKAVDIWY